MSVIVVRIVIMCIRSIAIDLFIRLQRSLPAAVVLIVVHPHLEDPSWNANLIAEILHQPFIPFLHSPPQTLREILHLFLLLLAELGPEPLLSTGALGEIETPVVMLASLAEEPLDRSRTWETVGERRRAWAWQRTWAWTRSWAWASTQARAMMGWRRWVVEAYEIGPGVGVIILIVLCVTAVEVTVASTGGAR